MPFPLLHSGSLVRGVTNRKGGGGEKYSLAESEGTFWETWPLRDNQNKNLLQPGTRAVGRWQKKGSTSYKLAAGFFFFFPIFIFTLVANFEETEDFV